MRRFVAFGFVGLASYLFGANSTNKSTSTFVSNPQPSSAIPCEPTEVVQLTIVPNSNIVEAAPSTALEIASKETSSSSDWYKTVSYSFLLVLSLKVGSSLFLNIMKAIEQRKKIEVPIVVVNSFVKGCYDHSLLVAELNSKMKDSKFLFTLCTTPNNNGPHLQCCFYLKDSRDMKIPFNNSVLYIVNSKIAETVDRPHMFVCAHTTTNLELMNVKNLVSYLEMNFVHTK